MNVIDFLSTYIRFALPPPKNKKKDDDDEDEEEDEKLKETVNMVLLSGVLFILLG